MTVEELAEKLHNKCREEDYVFVGMMVKDSGDGTGHTILPMCGKSVDLLAAICTIIVKYAEASGRTRNDVLMDIVGALGEEE